jgi:NAD(P)-dependent dehydrogenase (short-subunit alcohol dehydrogenase family)
MLNIDLTGKRALVAGVADDAGYGFAIAKALAEAGASVVVGTWPPALNIFRNLLERGKMDESLELSSGGKMAFESIYPLDAAFSTTLDSAPESIRTNKRYAEVGDFSIDGLATKLVADHGDKPLDIVVHSLANGSEVKKPLLETSRKGYLSAVVGVGVLDGLDGPALRTDHAAERRVHLADLHGERARDSGLRRRHVVREGRARERHARSPTKPVASTAIASTRSRRARTRRAPPARSASSRRWSATSRSATRR